MKITWIFYKFFWKDLWYDTLTGIKNLILYFNIVWKSRHWDSAFILEMLRFQLIQLHMNMKKHSSEIESSLHPKLKKMEDTIQLLTNVLDNNYMERCGYIQPNNRWFEPSEEHPNSYILKDDSTQTDEEIRKIIIDSNKLDKKELTQLLTNLKQIKHWWY